jgi:hypothetical protein
MEANRVQGNPPAAGAREMINLVHPTRSINLELELGADKDAGSKSGSPETKRCLRQCLRSAGWGASAQHFVERHQIAEPCEAKRDQPLLGAVE